MSLRCLVGLHKWHYVGMQERQFGRSWLQHPVNVCARCRKRSWA